MQKTHPTITRWNPGKPISCFAIAVGLLAGAMPTYATEVDFAAAGGSLRLTAPCWELTLDATSGAIRGLVDRAGNGVLLRGNDNLWVIQRHEAADVAAAECRMRHAWNAADRTLTLRYTHPAADVIIACRARDEGPTWHAAVRMHEGTMLAWRFPDAVEFAADQVNEFVFPENLGLAFTRNFFAPGGAGVRRHTLGGEGLRKVADDHCRMRPIPDEPVQATAGKDAAEWMPEWYLNELPRWRVTANRCPAGDQHDVVLIATEHGDWLTADGLGGWGWLLRFGGILQAGDTRPQIASVVATLWRLYHRPITSGDEIAAPADVVGKTFAALPSRPKRIGVLIGRPTARPGARMQPDPSDLLKELSRQEWVQQAGIELVVMRDADELRTALVRQPGEWYAIVNLNNEAVPAESPADAESMLHAIREYVRNGGVWWEAGGGYPFHYAVVPAADASFRTANRDFCDFAALDSTQGRWSMFGVQPRDAIFVTPAAEISASGPATDRRGRYAHRFLAFGPTGDVVRLPEQVMMLGRPHREALDEYARRNGFTRGLTDKARSELVERLKRCVLLKVDPHNLRHSKQIAEQLPHPVLFHTADYLRGGFDKEYPDHLPPNPAVGTPEDLSALIDTCRERGHVFMPYTNPTWWCVNPKGPTFERQGDAALARDLAGETYAESYDEAHVQGYATCCWHPDVRRANDVILKQFTRQYPVDVLFQDQVGARDHRWDTNPAAPHAGAYLEGVHRIARNDSAAVPLGTEDGHDRLINDELMFCGLSWPWLPNRPSRSRVLYEDLWPEASWRIEPLALFLAHDKVLFYHHDLGGFTRDRRDVSLSLVLGYGLSWVTRRVDPSAADQDWLDRLCRVQAAVGPRCAGRPLDEFEYLAPQVIRSRWGDLEVIANLTDEPWRVDAETEIAPEGFLARGPDLEAGILTRRKGESFADNGRWWIIEETAAVELEWSAATP